MSKTPRSRVDLVIGLLLVAITLAVFWQVAGFDFTNFDDDLYVENNPAVQAGLNSQTVRWAIKSSSLANWHPLTWMSLMADTDAAKIGSWFFDLSLGRKNSGFYHLTNLLLHLANVLLLFIVLNRLTGRRWASAFVAALFAVHPLHVESVAWVSERKDVLSMLFLLLTMLAYVRYTRDPERRGFVWVTAAYALGLAAKPMLVSLPIILLLLDYWPLGRLQVIGYRLQADGRDATTASASGQSQITDHGSQIPIRAFVVEKTPLFALALASCGLTVWAQGSGGAMGSTVAYPFGVRLANAVVAYVAYLWKALWPSGLSFLYLHPGTKLPVWQVVLSAAGLVVATVLALRAARKHPYLAVGWLWYLVTLVPVIGLVQVGKQAMADRYTYVPLIGIFIIVAWGLPELLRVKTPRAAAALGVAACAAVAALAIAAYPVVGDWKNSITLCTRAIQVDPANSLAYNNLGTALLADGDAGGAAASFRNALKYHPEYTDAQYNLANAFRLQGNTEAAIAQYRRVLKGCPKYVNAHNNLGSTLAQQGKLDEAIAEFEAALRLDPSNESARGNLENARQAKLGAP